MRYLSGPLSVATAIFSVAVSAVPKPAADMASSIRFEAPAQEGAPQYGRSALRKAYLKYGAKPPAALVARATQTGSVTATPTDSDAEYLIPVAVGSPAATYTMDLDTGSSDFTLNAPKLGTKGTVSTTVNIGGVTVKNQVVNVQNPYSNVVGVVPVGTNFYTNAIAQGMPAILTISLKKGAPGTYGLGSINPKAYQGSITYVSGDASQGFWGVSSNSYAIGSGTTVSSTIAGIVDTGTSLLYLPQALVDTYYKQVSGSAYDNTQGGYIFSCSATLPDLTLTFGSYKAKVAGSYLNFAPIDSGNKTCFGGLQSSSDIGISIFGLTFIKSQFIVLKGTSSPSIGFAKQA